MFLKEKAKKYPTYRVTFLSNNLELAEVYRHLYSTKIQDFLFEKGNIQKYKISKYFTLTIVFLFDYLILFYLGKMVKFAHVLTIEQVCPLLNCLISAHRGKSLILLLTSTRTPT